SIPPRRTRKSQDSPLRNHRQTKIQTTRQQQRKPQKKQRRNLPRRLPEKPQAKNLRQNKESTIKRNAERIYSCITSNRLIKDEPMSGRLAGKVAIVTGSGS